MTNMTANELRNSLNSILQSYNLSPILIDELLSDTFINGAYQLQQNEPENDGFMNFARNFSEEQNLRTMTDAQNRIYQELGKDGYFSSIFQYVIDAWRDIEFSVTVQQLMRVSNNQENNDDTIKPKAILDTVLTVARFVPPLKAAAEELNMYKNIAVAVHEQDKKFYQIADNFYNDMMNIATGIHKNFTTAKELPSPLIIDLDGDGVETLGTDSNVYFDHDGNGFAESTGWAGKDDGILIRDLNNNGQIDSGAELFGNNSVLASGKKAANGFEALKDYAA